MTNKPTARPARPNFSSGPCAKRPGWSPENLGVASLGRSHRSQIGKTRLKDAIARTRALLQLPDDYRIAIVPASDTGAMEMAMWTMLGALPVDMLAWESFGQGWVADAVKELGLDARVLDAPYGEIADLSAVDPGHDVVFTWNGTTSGVKVPNGDWISARRKGLVICDATSAIFAQALDWAKLDVVTFSWQKVLGGEGGHGVLILAPRAVERLLTFKPARPLPKIFRLVKAGELNEELFEGATINTPSMLCVEDYIDALKWAAGLGGLEALHQRTKENFNTLKEWVEKASWVEFLCADPAIRSNTSVCLKIVDPAFAALGGPAQRDFVKRMARRLEAEDAAYDVAGYRDAPPGLRVWCGATVERDDVEALCPWLDWAFEEAKG